MDKLLKEIEAEVSFAREKFPPFNTAHEGYAVLLEEVDELWEHVKVKQGRRDVDKMRREAVQVAAMALRFALDICDDGRGQR
jgi:NTP pyrophosphatase (non-canonical NTP hydrolase)